MHHGGHREAELMRGPGGVKVSSSALYQARADEAEIDASEAATEGQRQRHVESRKNWQRLSDDALTRETGEDK